MNALIGSSRQLIRRTPAIEMVLPSTTSLVVVDHQQRCAAGRSDDGWEVRALDGSGDIFQLEDGPGLGGWLWLD